MRDYEIVYIFRADLDREEVEERLERHHDRLDDGEVTTAEHWGQRELAYEIQDRRKGYYVVVQFRADPASLADFEQGLRHDEDLLRHLIVLSEGELPTPPSQRRDEDEEEDESGESGEEEEPEEDDEDREAEEEDEGDEAEEDEDDEDDGDEDEQDEEEDEDDEEDADEDEDEDEAARSGQGDDAGDEDDEASDEDADDADEEE